MTRTYKTEITLWSRIGHTPITNRGRAFCDTVLKVTVDCGDPEEARAKTRRLITETPDAERGHFNMPSHPNQNTRQAFV